MTRKAVAAALPAIISWDEAEEVLHQIGELTILKRLKTDRAQLAINEIKETLVIDLAPTEQKIVNFELALKGFCETERAKKDFKSRVLTFGSVFFRRATYLKTLKGVKWPDVLEALIEKGLEKYYKITTSVRKEELKQAGLPDIQLAELGLRIVVKTPFKYEINEEKFAKPEPADLIASRRAAPARA